MSNKYILDIENYLIPIEEIVKKYIQIEDIEYCVFSKKLRYPLLNKNECTELYHTPQMSMYCAPMIKDILKLLIAKKSLYYKYFIKNHIVNKESNFKLVEDVDSYCLENIILKHIPNITIEDVDMIETSIGHLEDYISRMDIPYDYIIEIDDEYIYHIVTPIKHILEVRIKEIEK